MNRLDLILVFAYTCGALLVLASVVRKSSPDPKVGPAKLGPLLAGLALLIYLGWSFGAKPIDLLQQAVSSVRGLTLAAGAAFVAGTVVHFLFTWVAGGPPRVSASGRPDDGGLARSGALTLACAGLVGAAVWGIHTEVQDRRPVPWVSSIDGLVAASFELPGGPTDIAMVDATTGYISIDIDFFTPDERSQIFRFTLPEAGGRGIQMEPVAEGLSYARGLAIAGDTLYVSDQGPLPCEGMALVDCVQGMHPERGEPSMLTLTKGRILAFTIQADGSLADRRVVLDDLPVVNSEHSVQDVDVGPDGRLYVSIGGPGQIARHPAVLESVERPNKEFLGTVVSFRTDGADPRIFARGLRNVFQLAFDEQGNLFGADNDGPGARAWKLEEVLHIREGAHYGFPYEGTFDVRSVRTGEPLWVQNTIGSAGLAWAGDVGMAPGLLLGSEKRIAFLALARDAEGFHVRNKNDLAQVLTLPSGNVTALETIPGSKTLMAGVYADVSRLLLLDFGRAATGGMLALTCTGCHGQTLTGLPGLGPDLTPSGNLSEWTREQFITTLRTGVRPDGTALDEQRMPWLQFAELPEEDLTLLWQYLQSPVRGSPD